MGGHPGPFQGRPLLCESLHGRAQRGLRRRALRHYYFRDFWRAGTGMLTALRVLAALGGQDWPLSQLTSGYTRYVASGEINCHVDDVPAKLDEVEAAWTRPGVGTGLLGGLSVTLGDGCWFNLRPPAPSLWAASTLKHPAETRWMPSAAKSLQLSGADRDEASPEHLLALGPASRGRDGTGSG